MQPELAQKVTHEYATRKGYLVELERLYAIALDERNVDMALVLLDKIRTL